MNPTAIVVGFLLSSSEMLYVAILEFYCNNIVRIL